MGRAAIDAAIAAAVPEAEAELAGEGTTPVDEGTVPVTETPPVEQAPTPVSQEVPAEVKPDVEVPTSLFGIDLSELPDDAAREKFITEFAETQAAFGKLQRENAELKKAQETPPVVASAPVVETEQPDYSVLSDEQLAEALGIDLESAIDPQATKLNLALTRKVLELTQTVEAVSTNTAATEMQRTWEATLARLESDYGELPVSREEVLRTAVASGITDPEAAYWAQAGPIRFQVAKALDERLKADRKAGKLGATTPRPSSSSGVQPAPLESKNVKDAVKEAAQAAMTQLGITFKE